MDIHPNVAKVRFCIWPGGALSCQSEILTFRPYLLIQIALHSCESAGRIRIPLNQFDGLVKWGPRASGKPSCTLYNNVPLVRVNYF